MEYLIARAMETARLGQDKIFILQEREEEQGRGLMPYEIQNRFNLPSLKETWNLPGTDNAMAAATNNVRKQLRSLNLMPKSGDLSVTDLKALHAFDEILISKLALNEIDFSWHGADRKRVSDEV